MSPTKLLLTGVTGYIGGTILSHLLSSIKSGTIDPSLKDIEISVLTRDDSRATYFSSTLNLKVHTITSLDDTPAITAAAAQNDIVIQCTSGYHGPSARALIRGLAQRRASQVNHTGVYYIHTDGTSNLGDKPITRTHIEPRTFSDRDRDIYEYLVRRNATEHYPQRAVSISVVDTGLEASVPTTTIMSPIIYGLGTGHYNRLSIPYIIQMRSAIRDGYACYVGDGSGQHDYVHVLDLAVVYELVLADFVSGRRKLPTGRDGIIFSESGNCTWREVAGHIARAGSELGVCDAEPRSVSLQEAASKWVGGDTQLVEVGFVGNHRTRGEVARDVLGWRAGRGREDWEGSFRVEMGEVVGEYRRGEVARVPGT
ncbi:hypothetical protein PMZ80_000705 [Knufia obscura]|uniref:NAD-dependent epimerase/dehydratase domain-containing protein n=2 Tax=Knufia TaxID=430999 RepID=A0AAN8E8M6_9EURO|nr:hypothetical protein PMZ80_000705 [Knufia obscura]KAK5949079.1 hypothetical protein OHC33_009820 [Knufia fluminis]